MIVPRHYENPNILFENTMPYRAYYIPASHDMGPLVCDRENSDRMVMLNGQWKFRYYESIYDLTDEFYKEDVGIKDAVFVPVPGVWQNYGYDFHQYTNVRYPIPLDPPYVPQENPCGTYLRQFEYHKDAAAPNAFLNFEGVDSCFYVWLNGQYVGYRQVSHANSEFDVTDVLREGANTLAVLVLKWCDGTYLEDQDKFRMSGIFRDVYILRRPENMIYDYFIKTQIHANADTAQNEGAAQNADTVQNTGATICVRVSAIGTVEGAQVKVLDRDGVPVAEGKLTHTGECSCEGDYSYGIELAIDNPMLWNPEQPYLYTVLFCTKEEVIHERIGIREVCVNNRIVCVNGNKIKFRGVNRHDFDPVTGYAIDIAQLKKDLVMMKQNNFNAIRSSHYPNAPYFYQLCDEYGFYVIDEADNESHGTQTQYLEDGSWDNVVQQWNKRIADNPEFIPATMDRTKLCVHRDKNRPSVVIWSMGNECAYGCTFEEALKWTKNFDDSRLTHYESAFYRSNDRKYDDSNIDIHSRMYPSFEEIRDYLSSDPDKPYLLVEYCHAMGNGPGDFEDYFQLIAANDIMCGGFVWEWCDHAIDKGIAENGKTMYFYGGDHGEELHDGNFCLDGLVYPDRTPHTGLAEYKNVHRPVRVASFVQKTGKLVLKNHMDFTKLHDFVSVQYELVRDGEVAAVGELEPDENGIAYVPVKELETNCDIGKCYLRVIYRNKTATPFAEEGYELGFEEIRLATKDCRNQAAVRHYESNAETGVQSQRNPGDVCVDEDDTSLTITGHGFVYVFNKRTGLFDRMNVFGEELLMHPMEINVWRAPTDNDRKIKQKWLAARYDHTVTRVYKTVCAGKPDGVEISVQSSVSAMSIQKILEMDVKWTVGAKGELAAEFKVQKNKEFPQLPRFGVRLFLDKKYDRVKYCGIGPFESYADKHFAGRHGIFEANVKELHEDYIRPQENGSHYDCDYVHVSSPESCLAVAAKEAFSFQASVYSQEELTKKRHNYELEESDSTILCLDYKQNGIGSASCGPELSKKYRFDEEEFEFSFKMFMAEMD